MHTYTLTGATLRDAFRLGLLPAHPMPELANATAGTPFQAFSEHQGDMRHELVKTLSNQGKPMTRLELAQKSEMGKTTVRREIEALVASGQVLKSKVYELGRWKFVYTLPANPNPIRRSPFYWWKRCPSCDADRKLRRMASGNYEHWCRCGHFQVISKEMVK